MGGIVSTAAMGLAASISIAGAVGLPSPRALGHKTCYRSPGWFNVLRTETVH